MSLSLLSVEQLRAAERDLVSEISTELRAQERHLVHHLTVEERCLGLALERVVRDRFADPVTVRAVIALVREASSPEDFQTLEDLLGPRSYPFGDAAA